MVGLFLVTFEYDWIWLGEFWLILHIYWILSNNFEFSLSHAHLARILPPTSFAHTSGHFWVHVDYILDAFDYFWRRLENSWIRLDDFEWSLIIFGYSWARSENVWIISNTSWVLLNTLEYFLDTGWVFLRYCWLWLGYFWLLLNMIEYVLVNSELFCIVLRYFRIISNSHFYTHT